MANIVLAEDDPATCYALERYLVSTGHTVRAFENSIDAWRAVSADGPDVLVTDIVFPAGQPHGVALARHAASRRRNMRTIYITAFPDLAETLVYEGAEVLRKPVDPERLAALIDGPAANAV